MADHECEHDHSEDFRDAPEDMRPDHDPEASAELRLILKPSPDGGWTTVILVRNVEVPTQQFLHIISETVGTVIRDMGVHQAAAELVAEAESYVQGEGGKDA